MQKGVGDFPETYAYDGKRVKKWSVNSKTYGQEWMPGDVIGCVIDVGRRSFFIDIFSFSFCLLRPTTSISPFSDLGHISYFRNGIPLGLAFDNVVVHTPGLAYFPALSLSTGERCYVNFGSKPFKYPVPGFAPVQLQQPSRKQEVDYLLDCLVRAAPFLIAQEGKLSPQVCLFPRTGSLPDWNSNPSFPLSGPFSTFLFLSNLPRKALDFCPLFSRRSPVDLRLSFRIPQSETPCFLSL